MPTEAEIKTKYKALHTNLSERYYGGTRGLSKDEFNAQHGQIWSDMEAELIAAGFITPPIPPRDLEAEIDELKALITEHIGEQ